MTRSLHIALDARWIFPKLSGIGLYTQELIGALARADCPHRFTLMFASRDVMERTAAHTGFDRHAAFSSRIVDRGPYAPADQVLTPGLLASWGIDAYHATNAMMPLYGARGVRRIVTVHDLIPLLFRDHAPKAKKNRLFPVYRWLMNTTAARADAIIAVSQATRADILHHLAVPGKEACKVHVIHEGVLPAYRPAPKPSRDHVQFLFVGRRDPYKNLPMLVRAIAELRNEGLPVRLRIVGADDPRYPEARELALSLALGDAIDWSGYVPDDALVAAYQQADVYVLPSRYEGFGLPVLEAMACGTPVICSNTSSLPEVAGDAALLIDPARPETLADAMRKVVRVPELRAEMARKGLTRAAMFSWDDTASRTIDVYEGVCADTAR